ncbi:Protein of unknown function DUF2148 [Desulfurobacterium thermolithotrophum DSM 11699]|uniref:DUF2148 domain-containing protein n=1 Tax=Desulfurobacterium thermolithotrophum (strain DSM 11699 / BSA) TaxID=868864 RepID=F0S498_DESTD|nr:DUF2148 domain-containing protein [Desulfurobacterium thermolithotrophum]ADY73670.1 Protein of unknown function DUF2148 [Desulfurobacterium thermolithotrophum DSM 11699]
MFEYISAVKTVAELMCCSAITAPKGKGVNLIYTKIFEKEEKDKVADLMEKIGKEKNIPFFIRDAKNVRDSLFVVFIGTEVKPRKVPFCGFCGFENCEKSAKAGAYCAYAVGDLGIAIGSAVKVASMHNIDNRVLFSFGKTAIIGGFIPSIVKLGYGIPLNVSGKNIYFDRKM